MSVSYARTLLEGAEMLLRGENVLFDWSLTDGERQEFAELFTELQSEAERAEAHRHIYNIGDTIDIDEAFPWLTEQKPDWKGKAGLVVDRRQEPDGSFSYQIDLESVEAAADRITREALGPQ